MEWIQAMDETKRSKALADAEENKVGASIAKLFGEDVEDLGDDSPIDTWTSAEADLDGRGGFDDRGGNVSSASATDSKAVKVSFVYCGDCGETTGDQAI